jgi:DNA-binding NtrC family response regulator
LERLGGNTVEQPDVRVITATNRDLREMVRTRLFREDLYFRIAVFAVHLPPLTERKGDIPLLVEHLVHAAAREEGKDIRGVAPEVMRLFEMHPWPGNVRQLQNVVARSAVVCNTDIISLRDLPDSFVQELQQLHSSDAVAVAARVAEVRTHDMEKAFATPVRSGPPGHSLTTIVQRLQSGPVAERLDYALSLAFPDAETLPRVDDLEAAGIRLAMHRLAGNLQMTARRLNVSRATLYRRLDAAQIHRSATPSTEERSLV